MNKFQISVSWQSHIFVANHARELYDICNFKGIVLIQSLLIFKYATNFTRSGHIYRLILYYEIVDLF